jgi:AcrR family transcriptional regulator
MEKTPFAIRWDLSIWTPHRGVEKGSALTVLNESEKTRTPSSISGWDRRRELLICEFEGVALRLFADRGYTSVTFEEIAANAKSSSRTLFRYFPRKEDFLLGIPRRGVVRLVQDIEHLEPSDTPLVAAWWFLRERLLRTTVDTNMLNLWRQATLEAPEVVARTRGERIEALVAALIKYCRRSLGDSAAQLDVHVASGVIAGAEVAMIHSWGRSGFDLEAIVEAADRAVGSLDLRRPAPRHQHPPS